MLVGREAVDKSTGLGLTAEAENFLENKILEILAKAKQKEEATHGEEQIPAQEENAEED